MPYGVYISGFRCSDLNEDGSEVQTNKIFVGGLAINTSKEAVKSYFTKYGAVLHCDLKKDRTTGFGFVHFDGEQSVERVCDVGMHQLQGRWIEVRKAVPAQQKQAQVSSGPARGRRDSPPTGSRAMREALLRGGMASRGGKRRSKSRSSSSSSSSSKRPARNKKRRKSRSRSVRSCSSSSSSVQVMAGAKRAAAAAALRQEPATKNPDVDQAKAEALQRLIGLKSVEPKEVRMKEWRALLREWHPDKNPERVEIATAVFQFLQKGKPMLESS